MKLVGHDFELSTGRQFYANHGILGLNEGLDALYEGYDGYAGSMDVPFTPAERREIADYMIALWNRFAEVGIVEAP